MVGRLDTRALVTMTDDELGRRYLELAYRRLECGFTPDHPTTRAHGARWARELVIVERECDRRGLFVDTNPDA